MLLLNNIFINNVHQPCYNRRANKELNGKLIIQENLLKVKDAEIQQLR